MNIGNCQLFNIDCMKLLQNYPNKYFDLAMVDPPWGKHAGRHGIKKSKLKSVHVYDDIRPDGTYINELLRVSKNQIIFSANLFDNVPLKTGGWVFWDKNNHYKIFGDGELIWVSCENKIRKFVFDMGYSRGFDYEKRIHPNEKPIEIYKWFLTEYAKEGYKILDTHFGSGSSICACIELGYEIIGSEIDEIYFNISKDRIKYHFNKYKEKLF